MAVEPLDGQGRRPVARLDASLRTPLPRPLRVGAGTALFVDGRCSHGGGRISGLRIEAGDAERELTAHGMPLPGTIAPGDYWWGIVSIESVAEAKSVPLGLRAAVAGAGEASAELDVLHLDPARHNGGPVATTPERVAICMATYEPPAELFARQVESIRSQSHGDWVCLISDDCSSPEALGAMGEAIGGDERFVVSRSNERLGFYANFERALGMAPADCAYVAFCDQDDRWYPEKLEILVDELRGGANLAYSDMRIVGDGGETIADTYWTIRRNNHDNFASLLITNTITGAASLFRRELLDLALPFPPRHGEMYHDHWVALCALATGEVRYVDRPLYDYVQHGAAALGHARANAGAMRRRRGLADRARMRARRMRMHRFRPGWRARYFDLYCRTALIARVLEIRCGERMAPRDRRVLRKVIEAESSPGAAGWLALRGLRPLLGHDETVGRERVLLRGVAWRRLARARALATRRRTTPADEAAAAWASPAVEATAAPGAGIAALGAPGESPRSGPGGAWLTPILVDYFARDGSTLMMRLLASSPNVAVEAEYPYERKYFTYLWRWARLLDRPEEPVPEWRRSALASISQESVLPLIGAPPWTPRKLLEGAEVPLSRACFEHAWREFSGRAIETTRRDHADPAAEVGYYAEKHLNTWLVDLATLPPVELVVLLRDPRDTYVSMLAFDRLRETQGFGQERSDDPGAHLEEVIVRQHQRLRWIAGLLEGGEVSVVRYEDLVLDLEGVAARLRSRLGIELDARAAARDRRLKRMHVTAGKPADSLGRWKRELPADVAATFAERLGDEMRAVGFDV